MLSEVEKLQSEALSRGDFVAFDLLSLSMGPENTDLLDGAGLETETKEMICTWAREHVIRGLR